MNKTAKWIIGICVSVVVVFACGALLAGWFIAKTAKEFVKSFGEMPSIEVDAGQVIVKNPAAHPIKDVSVRVDAITRTEPVQHIYYNLKAGEIAAHGTFKGPVTNAKSDGGLRFNPAQMKVWGTTISGGDGNGGTWSNGSSGG